MHLDARRQALRGKAGLGIISKAAVTKRWKVIHQLQQQFEACSQSSRTIP
jgi:hypothetical protein